MKFCKDCQFCKLNQEKPLESICTLVLYRNPITGEYQDRKCNIWNYNYKCDDFLKMPKNPITNEFKEEIQDDIKEQGEYLS